MLYCYSLIMMSMLSTASPDAFPVFENLPERPELPSPFVMMDGSQVETPEDWYDKRRPELKALFQHYVYGYMPDAPGITAKKEAEDAEILDGKGVLRQVVISTNGLPDDAPKIHLALFLPKSAATDFPIFLALNKCGNFTVLDESAIIKNEAAVYHDACPPLEELRGKDRDFWCIPYLISRGYGFATFHESDIDPDMDDFTDGIHPYYPELPGPDEARWGTIAAWAWGLQRAVDYLVTDPGVDAHKICVTGHSRRGKTALLAGAFDERIAVVNPHQSGTGGAALSRNNDQETVERINRVFPHWFNDVFPQFNDNEDKLPVDQHLLMALVAPRALIDTGGLQDTWANYEHALRALKAAAPVWEFLGVDGLKGEGMVLAPESITVDNAGKAVQYRRDTKHTMDQGYWEGILDFADLQFERK